MFVDDHNLMGGGQDNTITVRMSREEIEAIINSGKLIIGRNIGGNKIQVVVMMEEHPQAISSS